MFTPMKVLELFLLIPMVFIASQPSWANTAGERAKACGLTGDYKCSYEILKADMLVSNVDIVSPDSKVIKNGILTLYGAMLEVSLRKYSDSLDATEKRNEAEYIMDFIRERHPKTRDMWATLYTLRAEACMELDDEECVTESASFLCDNTSEISIPSASQKEQPAVTGRTLAIVDICRED